MERGIAVKTMAAIASLIIVADQLTKQLILASFEVGEIKTVINGFFNLTLTYNKGIAFGLFGNLPDSMRQIILVGATLCALALLVFFLFKEFSGDRPGQIGIALVLGGAIGNIIDRVRLGYVVDFLDFFYSTYHWPAFNVADSAICIGVALLLIRSGSSHGETEAETTRQQ